MTKNWRLRTNGLFRVASKRSYFFVSIQVVETAYACSPLPIAVDDRGGQRRLLPSSRTTMARPGLMFYFEDGRDYAAVDSNERK
jgi:hypothetical protein